MKYGSFVAAALASAGAAFAGTPPRHAPVIQVGVDLVRFDATVTDGQGRPVTDLRPEDFRLKVNGKVVPVENAVFFGPAATRAGAATDGTVADAAPADAPERSIVFLIDDLNLAPDGIAWTREALLAFAAKRDPHDASIGVRFTSDEGDRVLLSRNPERFEAAIGRLRHRAAPVLNPVQRDAAFQQRMYSILTTLNALRAAPGRKAVVLITDGLVVEAERGIRNQFSIRTPFEDLFEDGNSDAALRMISEVANRASTVVHTVYPRGLDAPWPGVDRSASYASWGGDEWFDIGSRTPSTANAGGSEEPLGPAVVGALDALERRQVLMSLAFETGGLAIFSRNGLDRALQEISDDQRSYYLIGFEPPKATFARSRVKTQFRSIKLTVDRKGVRVRTRAGFYGVTDDDVLQKAPLSVAMTPAPLPTP